MAPDPGPEDHFATNLKALRESRGMSQDDLADEMSKAGFSFHQTTIYKIETGARRVQFAEALALARLLGVPVERMSEPPGAHLAVLGELRGLIRECAEIRNRKLELAAWDFRETTDKLRALLRRGRAEDSQKIADADALRAVARAKRHLTAAETRDLEFAVEHYPVWYREAEGKMPKWNDMGAPF